MDEECSDLSFSQRMHATSGERLSVLPGSKQERSHGKVINDPIHKHFRLGPVAVQIMDSPQFQRLRDLKQLGLSYYIFPGASHNRFEHCLGVAHLAYELAMHFKVAQPELKIMNGDLKVVELAGLCHDLGHGPFSHVFDYLFLKQEQVSDWSHEEMSVKILDTIVEDKRLLESEALSQHELDRVKAMILAGSKDAPPAKDGRQFLHEIVANGRNGLDVDKYDYLTRDAYYCGVPIAAEIDRVKTYSKVLNNEICYKWSTYQCLLQIFQTRAALHQRVYGHRKAKAIDHMVVDALRAANPTLRITDRVHDPREFVKLDDTILKQIEYYGAFNPGWESSDEEEGHIRKAQSILKRLRDRDLYKYINEWVIPSDDVRRGWAPPEKAEIAGFAPNGLTIEPEDIVVMTLSVDLTAGPRNPLDNVHFYEFLDSTNSFAIRDQDITKLKLENYEERIMRVYSKKSDAASMAAVNTAAARYMQQRFGNRVTCSTPQRLGPPPGMPPGGSLVDPNRKRKLF